jgi:hypothetical protein
MSKKKAEFTKCDLMAGDFERIGTIGADIVEYGDIEKKRLGISGSIVGPRGSEIYYDWKCRDWAKFGSGPCASFEIKRSGPGVEKLGLKEKRWVGNLHGLLRQMSRDAAAVWGCKPSPTSGFEGTRPRRFRRRRRR